MHGRDICHLDLSLENLLMDETDTLKICDFGKIKTKKLLNYKKNIKKI
jgi:serine/threonine protein kinase